MRANSVVGILFSNVHDEKLPELTQKRTMASVPFGGRYRLIDFPLSNMVNSGIYSVGVVTKSNFQSLMDHLGSGKSWDLSRKREGLSLLPPFNDNGRENNSRVDALASIRNFLTSAKEKYVLLSDCDIVCNIDYKKVLDFHIKNKADITAIYSYGQVPKDMNEPTVYSLELDGQVRDLLINPKIEGPANYGLNMYIFDRRVLLQIIDDCASRNLSNFKRDVLQRNMFNYRFFAYQFDGYSKVIGSMRDYYDANMELMQCDVRQQLFNPKRPIYTKVRDDMPAHYGMNSCLNNSMVADGSIIEGEVDDCVLFRGVHVGKGSKLDHCVIMQDVVIGENCNLSHVVIDKDCTIKDGTSINGTDSYPVSISKGSVV
ncbi:MAG: glucose-1-phosphate adenylyltransferase subunit GlgD [Oscillospiraceae bacterium]|nr:glucose-1-phosphate adenylyltransferase subunit GlgD [Oscillospiraceae bacterium]